MSSKTVFLVALLLFLPLGAAADVVDRSVAIVNNETITLSEVNEVGQPLFEKVMRETPPNEREATMKQARHMVIDKLIEKKLILQEAKKYNAQVSDQEVEEAFQRIVTNNKITVEPPRKELANEGITEKQYREELQKQILSSKLVNHEVRTKVIITDDDILKYYNTHNVTTAGGEYHLLQIGCSWGKGGVSKEEARQKIEKARDLAIKGDDFNELAKKYSNLPSAADGGDLGNFQQDELAPAIREAVLQLKPGDVSPILEADNGYLFFKILARQQGQVVARDSLDEVKDQIREKLYQQAVEQRFKEWMTSIREKAYIKIF